MEHTLNSPPAKIPRFSESVEEEIHLGLELGLGSSYTQKADDQSLKRKAVDDHMQMGFTFMQKQELEQQAHIFKYIENRISVPYQLLFPIWKSVAGAVDCARFPFFPNLFGGSIGLSWKGSSDTEPGRCKRTDGKKWRCAKEAMPDHKYCEKHLHRGRQRSRKLVESSAMTMPSSANSSTSSVSHQVSPPPQTDAQILAQESTSLSIALPGVQ